MFEKLKIVFFIGGLSSGGAERVVTELSGYFSKKHDVTVLTWSDRTPYYKLAVDVKHCVLSSGNRKNWILKNINCLKNFIRFVREDNSDIYIAFLPLATYLLLIFKRFISAAILFSIRVDPEVEYKNFLMRRLAKIYMPKADGVVFQTQEQKQYFNNIKIRSGTVIPNSIASEFLVKSPIREKKNQIISVGRLTRQKNYELLLSAFAKIEKTFPEYKLKIFGEGPEKEKLENKIKELHIDKKVFLAGVSGSIKEELEDSSVFAMTSDYEGISNALLEAMAVGLPIVVTNSKGGGASMIIEDGINGLLTPVKDAEQFAASLSQVLSDKSLRERLSKGALHTIQQYRPEVIYGQWETYMSEAVNKRKGL